MVMYNSGDLDLLLLSTTRFLKGAHPSLWSAGRW